jgi:GT2 family glycosyltransferase
LFLQAALYSVVESIGTYEFIYVSNSPELAELILREAKAASINYGLAITVVLLSGNAGFGAANNAAARFSRTHRILVVNPDVFPIDTNWAETHNKIMNSRSADDTRLFGASLFYDDGSLMHAGMYFDVDVGVTLDAHGSRVCELARVEHYGKGFPQGSLSLKTRRRVPALTGAFMSFDRDWFEHLEGFTEAYVFGHYEDADLCLKSIDAGAWPWLEELEMWHLEGKGSTRLPVHEGGSLVNRWYFSSKWGPTLANGLTGSAPIRLFPVERH